jgi:hypothetical protein
MEKIKIIDLELNIISINQKGNLLEIEFPTATDLSGKNLQSIELYTSASK